jgi:hypothetical protein
MGNIMKKKEILKQLQERFAESESAASERRALYEKEYAFGDGDQWTQEELSARAGRPCVTINKLAGSIKQTSGDARRNVPHVKVRPVDSKSDPQVAKLFGALIRDIERNSSADSAYTHGLECAVRGGYGAWRIVTDYAEGKTFDQDIFIHRIVNPLSVYMDENSIQADYSDARYAFISEDIPVDVFTKRYPKAALTSFDDFNCDSWITSDTVRVVEYFYKVDYKAKLFELENGEIIELKKWQEATQEEPDETSPSGSRTVGYVIGDDMQDPVVFTKSRSVTRQKVEWVISNGVDILEGPHEWAGKYIPVIICPGEELWIDNKREMRSLIHHAIDAQKIYNWSRSNTIETLAQAPKQPYHITPEEVEGHEDQWSDSHTVPRPYRFFNDVGLGRPQPSAPSIPNTGAFREAAVSTDDIKATTGVYDASMGAQGNETSWLAIRGRQQQSSNSSFVFIDNQAKAIIYTAKQLVDLIPKIYDTERIVRLLNEDGSEAWEIVNQLDPETGEVINNDLSIGRYDVAYDIGPSFITRRQEAADGFMKVAQTAPQYMPMLMPDIAKNLDWPGADELAKKFAEAQKPKELPPELQLKLEEMKTKLEAERMKAQADIELKQLEIEKMKIELQKTMAEMGVSRHKEVVDQISRRVDLDSKSMDIKNKQLDLAGKAMQLSKEANDITGENASGIMVSV